MNNRPTPETYALYEQMMAKNPGNFIHLEEFLELACRLERERDEARRECKFLWRERDEVRETLRKAIRFVDAYEPHSPITEADQNKTLSIIRKVLEGAK